MTTYDEAISKAWEIGREHGQNAAAQWVYESSGWDRRVALAKIDGVYPFEDCTVADVAGLPAPDLSGEGDAPSSADLLDGMDPADVSWSVIADVQGAYELAFSEAVEEAVTRACRDAIGEPPVETAVCQTCGETVYPDASYASGYRHAYPGQLHGANAIQ